MTNPKEMTKDELKEALPDRLRTRKYRKGGESDETVYYLDLRPKMWGEIGTVVLHDPDDPSWPDSGTTTDHKSTAKNWINRKYADRIHGQLQGANPDLLVKDTVEPFIQAVHDDPKFGPEDSRVVSSRSYLRVHIGPKLGEHRLLTLPHDVVQEMLDNLEVTKSKHGVKRKEPASRATKQGVLYTLRWLYRHNYPDQPYPFAGVKINVPSKKARTRELIKQGRAWEAIEKKSFTPDEIFLQMAAARFIDMNPEYGIIANWACRMAAPSLAFQVGFGTRISELVEVREQDIDEKDGFALIPGTKSIEALRFMPFQDSLRPWLPELRRTKKGAVLPSHYLLRMHPERNALPNKTVWARRMGRIAALVGLKLPGERSHIYRRTHASWAHMKGIPPHEIKVFLGHANVFGGATDDYIQMIREMTRPEHRRYIEIPSPQELDEFLATGWVPKFARKQRGGGAPEPE